MSTSVVTFKDEDEIDGLPIGPVMVIRAEGEEAESAAAAGMPFAYKSEQATNYGWKTILEARALAAEHGVTLARW